MRTCRGKLRGLGDGAVEPPPGDRRVRSGSPSGRSASVHLGLVAGLLAEGFPLPRSCAGAAHQPQLVWGEPATKYSRGERPNPLHYTTAPPVEPGAAFGHGLALVELVPARQVDDSKMAHLSGVVAAVRSQPLAEWHRSRHCCEMKAGGVGPMR